MRERSLHPRLAAILLPSAFALGLFVLAAAIGYVYSHEPADDMLLVEFEGTPPPVPDYVTGSILSVEADRIRIALAAGGERDLTIPADTPIEELARLDSPPSDGASVNVGVDETDFGQVLSGVVAIEGPPQ